MLKAQLLERTAGPAKLFWYDDVPNFGDAMGPWLYNLITGRKTSNARGTIAEEYLVTIGSMIQAIDAPGSQIWGAGLIAPLSGDDVARLSKVPPRKVHAVRGLLTRDELITKLNWEVPAVFGDPALLLPYVYKPRRRLAASSGIALVPHYIHAPYVDSLKLGSTVTTIDVSRHPRDVVADIASARVVVSSSLHGLICAQAYGIPWVRLIAPSRALTGGDFKFQDFYSTLRGEIAEHATAPEDLDASKLESIAAAARLPVETFSRQALLNAVPLV
jgi:hypothetical protein